MDNRKLIKPTDLIIIAVIVIIAVILGIFLYGNNQGTTCVISLNGNVVKEIKLSQAESYEFALDNAPDVRFSVKDGEISFINATCKDKLCENVGYIKRIGETAICLPKRVVIKITGDTKNDIDMIVQ